MNIPPLRTRKIHGNSEGNERQKFTPLMPPRTTSNISEPVLNFKQYSQPRTKTKREKQESAINSSNNDNVPIESIFISHESESIEQLFVNNVKSSNIGDSDWIIFQFPKLAASHGTLRVHRSGNVSLDLSQDSNNPYPTAYNISMGSAAHFPQQFVMIQGSSFVPFGSPCAKVIATPQISSDILGE